MRCQKLTALHLLQNIASRSTPMMGCERVSNPIREGDMLPQHSTLLAQLLDAGLVEASPDRYNSGPATWYHVTAEGWRALEDGLSPTNTPP